MRELYNKNYGHSECIIIVNIIKKKGVTSCAHLNDGRLFSAGMDSACMVWDAR